MMLITDGKNRAYLTDKSVVAQGMHCLVGESNG